MVCARVKFFHFVFSKIYDAIALIFSSDNLLTFTVILFKWCQLFVTPGRTSSQQCPQNQCSTNPKLQASTGL